MMTTADALAAIKNGDLDALTTALDAGTDPNASDGDGNTLLIWSIFLNQLHIVNLLLSRGANVHLKALHITSVEWRRDVFRAVFSAAGPRTMNLPNLDGWTPLHYLARYGSAKQMAFALSHPGIDVSIRDTYGRTPLNVSIYNWSALQTYGEEEARWQPLRYTWIKLLMAPLP
jgi:ankyrin repeat protein